MPESVNEKELLQKLRKGDRIAFRQLFDQYYKYLVVTAFNLHGDRDKARDLAQDVFLELWRRREEIQIQSALKSYLRRAVVNKTINYIKAQRLNLGEEDHTFEREDHAASAQQLLEKEDLQELINETIEGLPEKCRLVFTLCRLEHLSHKEIAEKLDISTKTVENQMTKALKVLREALQPYLTQGLLLLWWLNFL